MTFACKHHEFETDTCRRLKCDCIMGRRGCVLEGRVTLTEDVKKKLQEIEKDRSVSKSSVSDTARQHDHRE